MMANTNINKIKQNKIISFNNKKINIKNSRIDDLNKIDFFYKYIHQNTFCIFIK